MMYPEIRLLDSTGTAMEILPDVGTIGYMDDSADVGTCTFEYPRDGIRAGLLGEGVRATLLLDGERIPNGDFTLQESTANLATDTPGFKTWVGRTDLQKLGSILHVKTYANAGAGLIDMGDAPLYAADGGTNPNWIGQNDWPRDQEYTSSRPGVVMQNAIFSANKRRASGDKIAYSFNGTYDSSGEAWRSYWAGNISVGMNLLEVVREMTNDGVAEARWEFGRLGLYDLAAVADPVAVTEFAVGKNLLDGPKESSITNLVTALFMVSDWTPETSEGSTETNMRLCGWVYLQAMIQKYGVIEGYKAVEGVSTLAGLREHGQNYLREMAREKSQHTYGFSPSEADKTIPYRHFGLGDWVSIDVDGVPTPERVKVITLDWDQNRVMRAGITTNDRFYEYDMARFKRTRL